jgi:hypothetical protein
VNDVAEISSAKEKASGEKHQRPVYENENVIAL